MRWDPFDEMRGLRLRMDRLFDDLGRAPRLLQWHTGELGFPVDLYESEDALVVKAPLPGVKAEEVDISVTGDVLTIKGETKTQEEVKRENYHCREIRYGAFARSIPLPTKVNFEKTEAVVDGGVLTVTLPKAEEVKPKTIKVKARPVIEGKS
jgi:HSP20 family protein